MHMDFQRIVEDQVIRMNVPIHFLNEDDALGVTEGGGKVSRLMTEIEVICLPKNLPEYLDIDIADLELDGLRYISDIPLPEGVEIPQLAQGEDYDHPIVSIQYIREEVIEEEIEEPGEVPVEGEAPDAAAADDAADGDGGETPEE